jgi:cytochrome c-type biogenesis protein CcmH/NrfG
MVNLRDAFWFATGLGVAIAASFLLRGWLSQRGTRPRLRAMKWPAFAALMLLVPALTYYAGRENSQQIATLAVSGDSRINRSAQSAKVHGGGSLDAMLAQLEHRLRDGGGTAADWELLAQTYDYLGRSSDASTVRHRHSVPTVAARDSDVERWPLILATLGTHGTGSAADAAAATATVDTTPVIVQSPANPKTRQLAQPSLDRAHQAMRTGNYAAAKSSYEQLVALGQMSAQDWADYADVLASLNGGELDGLALRCIEAALALEPTNEKALWLKASAQHSAGHYALAISTWKQLLTLTPAGSADANTFGQNLSEDQRLASGETAQHNGIVDTPASPVSAPPVQVSGVVTVAESLKAKIPTGLTLFIVAKSLNSPGAPVAVARMQTGQWPLKFTLDDSLAMMPERKLSTAGTVMVEVRVSPGGTAAIQSGDMQSAPTLVDPHSGKSIHLVIDHIIS